MLCQTTGHRVSRARFLLRNLGVYAIPPKLDEPGPKVTGVSCPDCGGVLMVRPEGRDTTLVFECRTGHTFDVPELVAAKEERLEEQLWSANRLLEELTQLLLDLAQRGAGHGESPASIEAYRRRAARAKASADAVRSILQDNRPVDLAPMHAAARSPGGAAGSSGEAGNG